MSNKLIIHTVLYRVILLIVKKNIMRLYFNYQILDYNGHNLVKDKLITALFL
jgi:hypothetical protein